MSALSANGVLSVWELGCHQPPLDRALTLLRHDADLLEADPADLTLGQRDARLLALREATFGRRLPGYVACPGCREPLEFELDAAELRAREVGAVETEVTVDGIRLRLRLPTSRDVVACLHGADHGADHGAGDGADHDRETRLLARCLTAPDQALQSGALVALAREARNDLCEVWAALDPGMETLLSLHCPACGHDWQQDFDIANFLWTEIASLARRLLLEVAELARAFAWREADILAMSAHRRHAYLQLLLLP